MHNFHSVQCGPGDEFAGRPSDAQMRGWHHQCARLVLGRVIHQHFALDDERRQHPRVVLGEALDAGVQQLDATLLGWRGLRVPKHMVTRMVDKTRLSRLSTVSNTSQNLIAFCMVSA